MSWLASNLQFAHRSWYVSRTGDTRRQLPKNVVEISPVDDWGQLAAWAADLCRDAAKVPVAVPGGRVQISRDEIAGYRAVSRYLTALESPDLTEKVIASALFDDLRAKESFELSWLTAQIEELLGLGPGLARSIATATVRLLVEMGLVERNEGLIRVRESQADNLIGRANAAWSDDRRRFFESVRSRLPVEARDVDGEWLDHLELALIAVCSTLGEEMAAWASRGIGTDVGWPEIEPIVEGLVNGEEAQRLASNVLRLLLSGPLDPEIPYMYRILASTYLANTVRLDPIASAQLRDSLSRYELYVDANVLLPLLVGDHPNHRSTKAVIDETIAAGVRLCVLPQFVNEVISHRNAARRDLREFDGDRVALRHVADVLGPRTNVFLQGYLDQRPRPQIGSHLPWQKYLGLYGDDAIWADIHAARIEVVEPAPTATDGPIYDEILPLIREEWRRKMGGPREDVLNSHEAVQFTHIYERRQLGGDLQRHVRFLSNETVLQRVFSKDPERWRLPATFPYSAWVAFLDSRLIHGANDPAAIVRAILKGQPHAFDLPTPVEMVRDKAFSGRVASRAEEEALEYAFSDFGVMKRLEAAQRALLRRGREGNSAKEFAEATQEAVAEVSDALDAQITRLRTELVRANDRIRDLEAIKKSDGKPPSIGRADNRRLRRRRK